MRVLIVISTILACAFAQFGGFGGRLPGGFANPLAGGNFPNPVTGITNLAGNFAAGIPGLNNVKNFGEFVAKTGKTYATAAEKTLREGIFKAKMSTVDKQNQAFASGQSSYELGINLFSDLKLDEFLNGLTGRKKSAQGEEIAVKHRNKAGPPVSTVIPDAFDWREKGGVTPVKFQGLECGACWSFAVTGAIEGHYFAKTGKLVPLSEQNLIDCGGDPYGSTGCDGGFQDYGFDYVLENHGIAKAEEYPFVEKTEQCHYTDPLKGATISGYSVIEAGNEKKMKEVIATKGPLACSVNAAPDSFQLYKSGIYKDTECNGEDVNHSILVVGYGVENGEDYWIIKNSWTDKWGEKGFMKLPRNSNSFCGIANECSFPVI